MLVVVVDCYVVTLDEPYWLRCWCTLLFTPLAGYIYVVALLTWLIALRCLLFHLRCCVIVTLGYLIYSSFDSYVGYTLPGYY